GGVPAPAGTSPPPPPPPPPPLVPLLHAAATSVIAMATRAIRRPCLPFIPPPPLCSFLAPVRSRSTARGARRAAPALPAPSRPRSAVPGSGERRRARLPRRGRRRSA